MPVNSWNTSPSNTSSLPAEERARDARSGLAIVLAAGEGTRMRSNLPKVLHRVANRAIVSHVLGAIAASGVESLAVVIGPDRDDVANEVRRTAPQASIHEQRERLGTAHAALAAREAIAAGADDVIVAFGDTPLVRPETFALLRQVLANGAAVVVLGFEAADPHGYGRLLMDNGQLLAIREEKDASEAERAVTLCNGGIMAIAGTHALSLLDSVRNDNAKGEYYLTDIVQLARERGLSVAVQVAEEAELLGINDRVQLAAAEAVLQHRLRETTMRNGVTMTAPETVFLSWDTVLGQDVVVEPHVVFGPGVRVDEGVVIRAFSHIEGAHIRARADAGPFARLRPGADIGEGAHIGNFVEVKNSVLSRGVKVGHLTYLGDSDVGADTNIGAGTITCNYDGWNKHRTVIGAGTFIGSNSSLVAPVTIGAGAYVASGSVVTEAVPSDALAIGRGRQVNKEDRARLFREAAETKDSPKKDGTV